MGARGMPQLDPQQPTAAQPQAQPDQIEQGLQTAAQFYQKQLQDSTPPPVQGGAVKRLLSNFFTGVGESMKESAGLPTDYEKQQKAVTGIQGIANAQGMLQLHQQMASQYAPVPLVGMDGKPITDPNTGQVISLPANHAATFYSGQAAAASRVQASQIGAGARIESAQINQGMMMPIPEELRQQLGLPEGTTQLPLKQFQQAISSATKPLATVQGANDQFQFNRLTGQQTALGVGNPRIAAQNARPVQVADPSVPGGIRYMPAGEAMRLGVQAPSSSTVKVPEGVLKDFTSGASAKTLNSFNTASDHLKILSDLGDALGNGNTPLINQLGNRFSTATGGAAPTTFDMAKQAVAGEIAKTFKGQATEGEISAINSTLSNAQSPAQLKGAIGTALRLMESKRAALMEQYDRGIKGAPAFPGGTQLNQGKASSFAEWKARQNGK